MAVRRRRVDFITSGKGGEVQSSLLHLFTIQGSRPIKDRLLSGTSIPPAVGRTKYQMQSCRTTVKRTISVDEASTLSNFASKGTAYIGGLMWVAAGKKLRGALK